MIIAYIIMFSYQNKPTGTLRVQYEYIKYFVTIIS